MLSHLLSNQFFWFVTRASGSLALFMLIVSGILGVAIRSGSLDRAVARFDVQDLHRFTSWLGFVFLGVHVFSLLGDRYVTFSLADVFVPLHSGYAEPWLSLGIIGLYLFVAVQITSYMTRQLHYRTWLGWHRLSYAALVLVLFHVLGTGTDRFAEWMLLALGIGLVLLVWALQHRRLRTGGSNAR